MIMEILSSMLERVKGALKERFLEHKGYVNNRILTKAAGAHFNEKAHSVNDMEITVVEMIFNKDP